MLYIEEKIKLVPGKANEYVEGVKNEYLPLAEELGLRLVGIWEAIPYRGNWPEMFSLWEIDDFDVYYGKLCKGRYENGALRNRYQAWLTKLSNCTTGTEGITLNPCHLNLSLEEMIKNGRKARVCLREEIYVFPGKASVYSEVIQKMWLDVAKRMGQWCIGTYQNISKNTVGINYFGADSWDTFGVGYGAMVKAFHEGKQADKDVDPEYGKWIEGIQLYAQVGYAFRQDWNNMLLNGVWGPII